MSNYINYMEKNTFNESVGKMLSLMDRMSGNMTAYEATLNEAQRINEAVAKNRVQVSRDEILDILDKADDELLPYDWANEYTLTKNAEVVTSQGGA